jgi:hypothetical protein
MSQEEIHSPLTTPLPSGCLLISTAQLEIEEKIVVEHGCRDDPQSISARIKDPPTSSHSSEPQPPRMIREITNPPAFLTSACRCWSNLPGKAHVHQKQARLGELWRQSTGVALFHRRWIATTVPKWDTSMAYTSVHAHCLCPAAE